MKAYALAFVLLGGGVVWTPRAAAEPPAPTCDDHTCDRQELEGIQLRTAKHLLRVQRERFEATNRGDDPVRLAHTERSFKRTQERWRGAMAALQRDEAASAQ